MDLVFNCPNCQQELAVEPEVAGSEIECPTCNTKVVVPEATDENLKEIEIPAPVPPPQPAAAPVHKHFAVPVRDGTEAPHEGLIKKPNVPLEVAAKEGDKKLRVKTIKHGDCVEVGKDKFDEIITAALEKIGETNLVSITPLPYSHVDVASRMLCTDYAVMIVYRG